MPAGSSTGIPTRCPAACTAWACRWSTRCRSGSIFQSGAAATVTPCASPTASPAAPLARVGGAGDRTGTEIAFWPSPRTFGSTEFDFTRLEHRLRELAFLNSGVAIALEDRRGAEPRAVTMRYDGGIEAFVAWLDRSKKPLHTPSVCIAGERDGTLVEIALQWNEGYHENVLCYTNNVPQADGGTHLAGFRSALTRTVNAWANETGIQKKEESHPRRRGHARGADLRAVGEGAPTPNSRRRPRTSW